MLSGSVNKWVHSPYDIRQKSRSSMLPVIQGECESKFADSEFHHGKRSFQLWLCAPKTEVSAFNPLRCGARTMCTSEGRLHLTERKHMLGSNMVQHAIRAQDASHLALYLRYSVQHCAWSVCHVRMPEFRQRPVLSQACEAITKRDQWGSR